MPLKGTFDFSKLEERLAIAEDKLKDETLSIYDEFFKDFTPKLKYTCGEGESRDSVNEELKKGLCEEIRANVDKYGYADYWYGTRISQKEVVWWTNWVAENKAITDIKVKAKAKQLNRRNRELLIQFNKRLRKASTNIDIELKKRRS